LSGGEELDRPGQLRIGAGGLPWWRLAIGDTRNHAGSVFGVGHQVLWGDTELVDLAFVRGQPVGDRDPRAAAVAQAVDVLNRPFTKSLFAHEIGGCARVA